MYGGPAPQIYRQLGWAPTTLGEFVTEMSDQQRWNPTTTTSDRESDGDPFEELEERLDWDEENDIGDGNNSDTSSSVGVGGARVRT